MNDNDLEERETDTAQSLDTEKRAESRKIYWSGLITGLLITLLICCCVYLANRIASIRLQSEADLQVDSNSDEDELSVTNQAVIDKLNILVNAVDEYYLKDSDTQAMIDGMYAGLIDSLGDTYSVYYTEEEINALLDQTQGIYFGIGAYIGFDEDANMCYVSKLIKGTPAEASELLQGDYIVMVDGTDTIGMSTSDIVTLIKGEEGTSVIVSVMRENSTEVIDISVTRAKIETPTVEYEMLENKIGYIEITEFDTVTYNQFKEAYDTLNNQGMKALVLDLRANPGGNVSTVCDISRLLLPEGLIVYTEDKDGYRTEYQCDGKNEIQIPLVVLIDGNSASASEILAGAIKDYEIGTLMGTTSFGKGIVQRIISISDGTAIKLTVSNYFTPNGNYIHGVGIEPDITVEWDYDAYVQDGLDNQKEAAYQYLLDEIGDE